MHECKMCEQGNVASRKLSMMLHKLQCVEMAGGPRVQFSGRFIQKDPWVMIIFEKILLSKEPADVRDENPKAKSVSVASRYIPVHP